MERDRGKYLLRRNQAEAQPRARSCIGTPHFRSRLRTEQENHRHCWRFRLVWLSRKQLKLLECFLVATLVLALSKALVLTLVIVLIVVLALAWRLVGTLN